MRKLNESQKKWALTACLATVLSFNLVMGLTGSSYGTLNFASTAEDDASDVPVEALLDEPKFSRLITEEGKLKVKYLKEEDGSTKAIVPKIVEGKYCWEDCGKTYLLPKNFESSAEDLEMALRKAMKKDSVKVAAKESDETGEWKNQLKINMPKRDLQDQDREEIGEDKELEALEKKCDAKDEEDDSRMQCFANGLTKLLKDKKGDHPKELVLAMYKKEIEPTLIEALSDVRDSDRRESGQQILEDMLSSVSKKYNYVRERMVKLSALTVIKAQQDAQKRLRQAEQMKTTNPAQAMRLQQEGYQRRSFAENLALNLDSTLQSGLESAQFSRLISENQVIDLYTTNYANIVNPIIQGMRQDALNYAIPTTQLSEIAILTDMNGNSVSVTAPVGAISQLRAQGRGVTVIQNGLSAANVVTTGTPRIVTLNGMNNAAGTATIQVIPANQVPSAQMPTQFAPVGPGAVRGR